MADDKSKRGGNDRGRVASDEPYEVDYFARKHGISRDEAQALIERIGNDRDRLDAAAAEQKGAAAEQKSVAAPAKPRRAPRATTAARSEASPKPRRAKATAAKRPAAARATDALSVAAVADTVSAAVVEPVAEIVAPVTRQAKAATTRAARAVKDSSKVGTTVAKAPAAVRKGTGKSVDGVKKAASSRTASVVGAVAAGVVTGLVLNLGRKAVVQAPSALAGDWFEAVKLEHRLALALFDKLQATGNENTTQRSVLLTQLKHALGKHAFTEENVLYPALRAWGDTADADKLNHDHGYVKQNLYDLEQMDNGSPAFLDKVATFRAEIEEHIREEEDAIFPPLHAALGDSGNAKVTALANKEGFKLA